MIFLFYLDSNINVFRGIAVVLGSDNPLWSLVLADQLTGKVDFANSFSLLVC